MSSSDNGVPSTGWAGQDGQVSRRTRPGHGGGLELFGTRRCRPGPGRRPPSRSPTASRRRSRRRLPGVGQHVAGHGGVAGTDGAAHGDQGQAGVPGSLGDPRAQARPHRGGGHHSADTALDERAGCSGLLQGLQQPSRPSNRRASYAGQLGRLLGVRLEQVGRGVEAVREGEQRRVRGCRRSGSPTDAAPGQVNVPSGREDAGRQQPDSTTMARSDSSTSRLARRSTTSASRLGPGSLIFVVVPSASVR